MISEAVGVPLVEGYLRQGPPRRKPKPRRPSANKINVPGSGVSATVIRPTPTSVAITRYVSGQPNALASASAPAPDAIMPKR